MRAHTHTESWTVVAARVSAAAPWAVLLLIASRPQGARAFDSPTGLVVLGAGATADVGDALVMTPATLVGNITLIGPPEFAGSTSALRGMVRASDYDADMDGIPDAIVDGEICALDDAGRSSFSARGSREVWAYASGCSSGRPR